jgi:adenylosuccinate lyase
MEFKYFYPDMRWVFTEVYKLQRWLDVEAVLA